MSRDTDFMVDTYAAEVETLPVSLHAILWVTAAFLLIAIGWANFATLEEVARADGRVIPSSEVQVVQNLEGGIVAEILVRNGDLVTEGQPLIRIDDTRFASSFNEGRMTSQALTARIARLQAEIDGTTFDSTTTPSTDDSLLQDEVRLFQTRREQLESSLQILGQQLLQHQQALAELQREEQKQTANTRLAREELALTEPLVETGASSRVELLRLKAAVNDAEGQLEITRLAIPKAEAVVTEARQKIQERQQQFVNEAQRDLTDARRELERIRISNVALEDRVRRTSVTAPVEGTVKQVLVNSVGSVIQPGVDLVEIVPANDTLLIEAKIRPADVAFIHPGQAATVKITAYDFAIYGGLDGVLELISADSITDERGEHFFEIRVRTRQNHLGTDESPLPIIPGMVASVDIITGEKTVMDYLLKPLKRAQANALTER